VAKRRQTYNLDRQTKLFDIHKQFMGGLKTIDTDDALGSVYLRDINNLSLSEFGFLEKRYGTYVSDEFPGIEFQGDKPIQGYFEYVDDDGEVHKILFYNGICYIKNPKAENVQDRDVYVVQQSFETEPGFIYPDPDILKSKVDWNEVDFLENVFSNVTASFQFEIDDFKNPFVRYTAPIFADFNFEIFVQSNKSQTSNNEILPSFEFGIITGKNITESYTKAISISFDFGIITDEDVNESVSKSIGISFTYDIITGSNALTSTNHNIDSSFTYNVTQVTQENFDSSNEEDIDASFTYDVTQFIQENFESSNEKNIDAIFAFNVTQF
jgi:hypothetical protein